MRIYEYGRDSFPAADCVLAIGFFDGVHIAHRELIKRAAKRARELSLPLGIFTFGSEDSIKSGVKRIYSTEQRMLIFSELGVDFCVISPFSDIKDMSAEEFCRRVLWDTLRCRVCAVGYNFRFGRDASGDSELMRSVMTALGGEAIICEEQRVGDATASSSAVRKMLEIGDVKGAGAMLGAPYFAEGFVTHGRGIGNRKLGVPTINVATPENALIPRLGVYSASVEVDKRLYPAVLNLGVCPTYGERRVHVEAHLLDFSGDLYGKFVKVNFLSFLRDEKRFSDEKELKMQIQADILAAIKENRGIK